MRRTLLFSIYPMRSPRGRPGWRRLVLQRAGVALPAALVYGVLSLSPVWGAPCVSGLANSLVFPCTLDDKNVSNPFFSSNVTNGAHGTTGTFDHTALNPGFTIATNPSTPLVAPPDLNGVLSFTIATISGLPLIEDISASSSVRLSPERGVSAWRSSLPVVTCP